MKKLLIINYYWPPSGGAVVQRWLYITKYLIEFGIECFVITIDEKEATFPNLDLDLAKEVSPSIKVFKTPTSEILKFYKQIKGEKKTGNIAVNNDQANFPEKVSRFIRGNFFLPDARRGWYPHAVAKAKKALEQYDINHFVTVGPPHSTHLAGLKVKKMFPQKKWIADMHDYWQGNFVLPMFYRTSLANLVDGNYEKKTVRQSDFLMVHCRTAKRRIINRYEGVDANKIHIHTMGFNEELFNQGNKLVNENKDLFFISYTGSLNNNYYPEVFFRALKKCVDKFSPRKKIIFRLAGTIATSITKYIEKIGLKPNYQYLGYVTHKEVIKLLKSSHALLLVNPKDEQDKGIVPGKLYEYLAARKPIISIASHGSENEEIIIENEAGENFEREEEEKMFAYLVDLVENKKNINNGKIENIKKYARREETKKLVEKLNKLSFLKNSNSRMI